jgi:hypothetical protein
MSETVAPAAPAAAPSGVVASAASALAAACSFLTQKMFICRPDLLGLLRRSGAGGIVGRKSLATVAARLLTPFRRARCDSSHSACALQPNAQLWFSAGPT